MYKYFYFSSTSNTRFGVPTKPVGIVYVKFQNSKSLADPHISLSTSINTEGGTDTYLIVEWAPPFSPAKPSKNVMFTFPDTFTERPWTSSQDETSLVFLKVPTMMEKIDFAVP